MIPPTGGCLEAVVLSLLPFTFFCFGKRAFTTLRSTGRLILLMFLTVARGVEAIESLLDSWLDS